MSAALITRIHTYFIPSRYTADEFLFKRAKIFINTTLLTSLFSLFYVCVTILYGMEKLLYSVSVCSILFLVFAWLLKYGLSLKTSVTLYTSLTYISCVFEVYWDGGLYSPVLPWMATLPVLSLMLNNSRRSVFWMILALLSILVIGVMGMYGYHFPIEMNRGSRQVYMISCYSGVVMILFVITSVVEHGQNTALIKLSEQSLLLAEEKKKTALYNISQELHDNIGQTLSLIKVNLHMSQFLEDAALKKKLSDTLELVAKATKDIREISHSLNAENITEFSILEAIRDQVVSISKIGNYLTDFAVTGSHRKMSPQTELILFRIVQEVINNIIKHSKAKSIRIAAHYDTLQFSLTIDDDGIGIAREKLLEDGQGVRTMRSRAELIGGVFNIQSELNKGTTINVKLPIKST